MMTTYRHYAQFSCRKMTRLLPSVLLELLRVGWLISFSVLIISSAGTDAAATTNFHRSVLVAGSRGGGEAEDKMRLHRGLHRERDNWWLNFCEKVPLGLKNGVASGLAAAVCKCE